MRAGKHFKLLIFVSILWVGYTLPNVYCALLSQWLIDAAVPYVVVCVILLCLSSSEGGLSRRRRVCGVRGVMSHITRDVSPHHPYHLIIVTTIIANFRHFGLTLFEFRCKCAYILNCSLAPTGAHEMHMSVWPWLCMRNKPPSFFNF